MHKRLTIPIVGIIQISSYENLVHINDKIKEENLQVSEVESTF